MLVRSGASSIFAVDNLGLCWMHRKAALRKPRFQRSLNRLRLLHAFAVHEPVIRIPAPGRLGIGPRHPDVERIMQEEIGQQRTNDAPLRSSPRALHKGSIRKLQGSRQPPLNIEPYPFAIRMLIQCLQQQPMLDVVEPT